MNAKRRNRMLRSAGLALGYLTMMTVCACGSADAESNSEETGQSGEELKKRRRVDLNECACIDISQVEDCRAGSTCTSYTEIHGQYDTYYCKAEKKNFRCPKFADHTCRAGGYPPNGMKCCSGAEYVGSLLLCKPNN